MYILAIDQGTTGSTSLLVNESNFEIIAKANNEFRQILPEPGIVEHNLNDIWESVKKSTLQVLNETGIDPKLITSIGITNQRETITAFSKSGEQIENAIVWQDRRTSNYCTKLRESGYEEKVSQLTGLTLDPYFSGTKINWLINNSEKIKSAIRENNCYFGNIDTYLLFKLTDGKSYFTEATNASRTMLMDLRTTNWSNDLCELLEVPINCLPEIRPSFGNFGKTQGLDFLPDGIPITGVLGDQQSALFGQGGISKGDLKCTYGTGAFALINTGEQIKFSNNGLLTTVAYSTDTSTTYAIEGSSYIAGAAVQWLRDNLGIINSAPEVEQLALKINNLDEMKNLCFYPYFTGIGSPYWKSEATASIQGITRDTNKNHLSLACLESIALTIDDLIRAMEKDSSNQIKTLRVDGGAVANNTLNQLQASFSDVTVERPEVIETTALGAALASAIGNNKIDIQDVKRFSRVEKRFEPTNEKYFKDKLTTWKNNQQRTYLSNT